MWDKLIIALVIAGAGFSAGWWVGTRAQQTALHKCQQARAQDQTAQERRTAQRAISNAETITRLRNERDAKIAKARKIERDAATRNANLVRELRERDAALVAALQNGDDCVVAADAIRLLDDAASGSAGLPEAAGPGAAPGASAGAASRAAQSR